MSIYVYHQPHNTDYVVLFFCYRFCAAIPVCTPPGRDPKSIVCYPMQINETGKRGCT